MVKYTVREPSESDVIEIKLKESLKKMGEVPSV